MTTVRQAIDEDVVPPRPPSVASPSVGTGHHAEPPSATASGTTRQARRLEHRRLVREEIAAVVVLAVLLAATLVLLGLQWLDTGTPTSAAPLLHLPGGIT